MKKAIHLSMATAASLAACASPALIGGTPRAGDGKHSRTNRFVRANVGRNHPDYGLSIEEHAANKLARSGKTY